MICIYARTQYLSPGKRAQRYARLNCLNKPSSAIPALVRPLAQAAARHFELHVNGWTDDPETARRRGIELSRQALQFASDDANVLSQVAYILAYFGEEIDVAIAFLDQGLKLNPSPVWGWKWGGVLGLGA